MHPWNPEGHETRLGSRKRKTKKEEEEEKKTAEEENGEKKGPLTRWHTSISISRRHREAYREPVRMHLCALACTERASANAELDNSLGTISAVARNLPNCRFGLAEDLHHFISYLTTSIIGNIFAACEICRDFSCRENQIPEYKKVDGVVSFYPFLSVEHLLPYNIILIFYINDDRNIAISNFSLFIFSSFCCLFLSIFGRNKIMKITFPKYNIKKSLINAYICNDSIQT